MAQPQRVAPGPVGTSCLTCRRRHKKCDLRRPVCERCEKGGFECLGYSQTKRDVAHLMPLGPPGQRSIQPKQSGTKAPDQPAASSFTWPVNGMDSVSIESLVVPGVEDMDPTVSSLSGSSSVSLEVCLDDQLRGTTRRYNDANDVDTYRDSETIPNCQQLSIANPPVKRAASPIPSLQSLFALYTQIPYAPYHFSKTKTLLDSSNLEDYVMAHHDQMMAFTYFKPVQNQVAELQNLVVSRMRDSSFTRWIMFLCAKICESFVKGDTTQNQTYHLWINQVEQAIRAALTRNPATSEIQDRLGDWLEVLILKTMVTHSSNTYQVLRNATPRFLQMVFSDPTLWPSNCDSTAIPLINVMASPRQELAHFVMIETTAAMAFGLPQQVEYDTSIGCLQSCSPPHEWVHSSPIEFQVALAEINACRDKSPNARNWEEIEFKLTTWQPRPGGYDPNWESWMVVAWFAVQESLRHTLLAYLYMAVCGASSDDPRIQSSVKQILHVIGTVKKHESSDANVPFFIQYLMAGICARSEKHRSIVREHLANVFETKFWLIRAIDFVPVLDDLWHGAAADGRPIKWNDYVRARERVLPVVL